MAVLAFVADAHGLLGDLLDVRVRTLHDNSVKYANGTFPDFGYVYDIAESGGGAMNNMGCHGVKLLRWFLGRPVSAFGMYTSITEAAQKDGIEENAVTVYRIIAKDSVEEKILALQEAKRGLADAIISGENTSITSLSNEELLELLE